MDIHGSCYKKNNLARLYVDSKTFVKINHSLPEAFMAVVVIFVVAIVTYGAQATFQWVFPPQGTTPTWAVGAYWVSLFLIFPALLGIVLSRRWMEFLLPVGAFAGLFLWHVTFAAGDLSDLIGDSGIAGAILGLVGLSGAIVIGYEVGRGLLRWRI